MRSVSTASEPDRDSVWTRLLGAVLLLPLGFIVLAVLLYFGVYRRGYLQGDVLLIVLVLFLLLWTVRMLFWRSRRQNRRRYWRQDQSIRILRERYARGEITKEEFDKMRRDLEENR